MWKTRHLTMTTLALLLGLALTPAWAAHRHRPPRLDQPILIELGPGTIRTLAPNSLTAAGYEDLEGVQSGAIVYPRHQRVEPTGQLLGSFVNGAYGERVVGVGQFVDSRRSDVYTTHAFVREADGTYRDLGTLGGEGLFSAANALNETDIVGYGDSADQSHIAPILWPGGGTALALPTLGGTNGHANGINSDGVTTGDTQTAAGYTHCTVWYPDGTVVDCHDSTLGHTSFGIFVSSDETVTGWIVGFDGRMQPFRWTLEGGMVLLPLLPGDTFGLTTMRAENGLISGRSCHMDGRDAVCRAVLWDRHDRVEDLNGRLQADSGWVLTQAWVNDLVIVGVGLLDGVWQSWALVPPPGRLAFVAPPRAPLPPPRAPLPRAPGTP